jgi:ATP synthase F1 delta subunit
MKPTPAQYAKVLLQLSQESSASAWPEVSARFLAFLNRRKETKKLPAILRNVERLHDEASGVKRVQMTTSKVLSDTEQQAVLDHIKKLFATETIILDQKIDTHVIGGITLRTENELFDGTVRKRLSELKRVLL